MKVGFVYDHENRAFPEFFVNDLYVEGSPDVYNFGAGDSVLTSDKGGLDDWKVMGSKSLVQCTDVGYCTFNIHFMREFNTFDLNDTDITKGVSEIYDV